MQIEFEYDGTPYKLEYCRKTVQLMEARGLVAGEISSKPATMFPLLFWGAFAMHHPQVTKKEADAIFEVIDDKEGLIPKLIDMYNEPIESLIEKAPKGKTVGWTVVK